jgi:nucleoside-diphosphate-sugar epimerase
MDTAKRFLVTGATGFLGSAITKLLLERNFLVRGTVRNKSNQKKLLPLLTLPNNHNLELVEADLLDADCWTNAIKSCNYIMHVASPFPSAYPKTEEEVIRPAVEGTLNVLQAAYKNNIEHVVLTSSIATVQSIGKSAKEFYTEEDWTDLGTATPYYKSKTMAEKAAWEYYNSLPKSNRFRLTSILPGLIFGPALVTSDFTSGEVVKELLTGGAPVIPKINYGIVDVRDVSLAHLRAIECGEKSDGQRYICCSDANMWFEEIAEVLRKEFGKYGYRVPKWKMKHYQLKLISLFYSKGKTLLPFWGQYQRYSNEKIRRDLRISFRSAEDAIISMGYSMIENKVVPNLIKVPKL